MLKQGKIYNEKCPLDMVLFFTILFAFIGRLLDLIDIIILYPPPSPILYFVKSSNITYKSKYKLVSCKYVKKCPLDMLILKERKNKIQKN